MKVVKASGGGHSLSISRAEWLDIGRKARWVTADGDGKMEAAGAEDRSTEAIAKKHGVPEEQIEKELAKGVEIEREHTDLLDLIKEFLEKNGLKMPISDDEFFEKIARAHNAEVADYYEKLVKHVEPKGS